MSPLLLKVRICSIDQKAVNGLTDGAAEQPFRKILVGLSMDVQGISREIIRHMLKIYQRAGALARMILSSVLAAAWTVWQRKSRPCIAVRWAECREPAIRQFHYFI